MRPVWHGLCSHSNIQKGETVRRLSCASDGDVRSWTRPAFLRPLHLLERSQSHESNGSQDARGLLSLTLRPSLPIHRGLSHIWCDAVHAQKALRLGATHQGSIQKNDMLADMQALDLLCAQICKPADSPIEQQLMMN